MNKAKIVSALTFLLLVSQSPAVVYSAGKEKEPQRKLKDEPAEYGKLNPELQKLKAEYANLLNENEVLKNENKALREDRDNLLNRAKGLLADVNRLKELEDSAGSMVKEKDTLEKERLDLGNANTALKEELNKLQEVQKEIILERDYARSAYEKSNKGNAIKELKGEIARLEKEKGGKISGLEKEKNTVEANLKQSEKEFNQLKEQNLKLGQERESLDAQLNEYKANYKKAEEKNKALEGEIKNMPKKFTELARQNKHLIRETAQMHYNLGVFYTRNKEYERAVSEFEKVIEITPDDAYAHFNLGYIYAQYLVNRKKAIESFRLYLRLAKAADKDIDWAKKYLLTWETYEGKIPMQ